MKGIIHYQTEEYGCIKVKLSLNFLAKVCYSLECKIEDLLEYCPPNNENK